MPKLGIKNHSLKYWKRDMRRGEISKEEFEKMKEKK